MKFSHLLPIVLSVPLLLSCASSGRLINLEVEDDEAIVIGGLTVFYNDVDVTEKTTILFNEIMWGNYPYKADSSGLIITKLPLGQNHVARVVYRSFTTNLRKEYATFNLEDNQKIHYVGDIHIDWHGPKFKFNPGGMLFALADEASPDGVLKITVEDRFSDCLASFQDQFTTSKVATKSLLRIDPSKLHESMKTDEDYTHRILLDDSENLFGEILDVSEKQLYLGKHDTLYIIKIDRIKTIFKNNEVISIFELSSRSFDKMNFGKYPKTEYVK